MTGGAEAAAVAVVAGAARPDGFTAMIEALRARGIEAVRTAPDEWPLCLPDGVRVVVVGEARSFEMLYVLRHARRLGACTVLAAPGSAGDRRAPVDVSLAGDDPGKLADALAELVRRPRRRPLPAHRLDPTRLPPHLPATPGRPRAVSLVRCAASPVGGVTTWSQRLAQAFAQRDLGYDVRTLLVVTHHDSIPEATETDGLTQVCVADPMGDHWEAVRTVRSALERLEPAIVIPNYADLCYAAAMQLGPHGVRTIAVAHTHHDSCRRLIETYDRWDGAAGVSDACMSWLKPLAAGRPVARIPCAAPVAPEPRRVEPGGPLKLAYVGRMVEVQKRISDLLLLADGLEQLAVRYELHVVGDGEDLDAWRRSLAQRRLRHGRVVVHGRRTAQWVQRLLAGIDASVLLSEFEGTSVTMLEAMGAGVVPAVTRVDSGVDEWISDGVNGVTVPVGRPDLMAARLAELAADRGRLAAMGRAAWQTVRGALGVESMADQYRDLFDAVRARPVDLSPSDTGLRLCDGYTWHAEHAERPGEAMAWIESVLREAGYREIAVGEPSAGSDAVIVRAGDGEPVEAKVAEYRARGLGVAVWPHLLESPVTERMHRLGRQCLDDGCRRIAIYGIGRHTRRAAGLLERGLPVVGFIDDHPPGSRRVFGLPVVPVERALVELKPDAVILSSDAWEAELWRRSAPLRAAGVRVLAMYGDYEAAGSA